MIHSFKIVNDTGETLDLDIKKPEDTGFAVTSVIGLTYPTADISVAEYVTFDGAIFGNNRIPQRNIVMQLLFYQENRPRLSIEQLRHKCNLFFRIKKQITFYVTNDSGTYWIRGYIEANDINIFTNSEGARISIICDDPYFTKTNTEIAASVSKVIPNFSFPCSFEFIRDTENENDGLTGTITGIDYNYNPVDISIEDARLFENDSGGYEVFIPPDEIFDEPT